MSSAHHQLETQLAQAPPPPSPSALLITSNTVNNTLCRHFRGERERVVLRLSALLSCHLSKIRRTQIWCALGDKKEVSIELQHTATKTAISFSHFNANPPRGQIRTNSRQQVSTLSLLDRRARNIVNCCQCRYYTFTFKHTKRRRRRRRAINDDADWLWVCACGECKLLIDRKYANKQQLLLRCATSAAAAAAAIEHPHHRRYYWESFCWCTPSCAASCHTKKY